MKEKKIMKLWQFIVIICLLSIMFMTMFIPMFSLSGNSMIKGTKKVFQKMDLSMLGINEAGIDQYLQQLADQVDEQIKDYEEEYHVRISSISPWNIMTKNFVKFFAGDVEDKEEALESIQEDEMLRTLQKGYNSLRLLFWVVYAAVLFVLVLNIVGFCVKLVKYIALGVNTFLGLFVFSNFAFLRFGAIGAAVAQAEKMIDEMGMGYITSYIDMKPIVKAVMSGLYVLPFTILILASSALLMIGSILFMFIGKSKASSVQGNYENSPFGEMQNDFAEQSFGEMQSNFADQPFGEVQNNFAEQSFGAAQNDFADQPFGTMQNDYQDQVTVPMMDAYQEASSESAFAGYQDQVTVPMTGDFAEPADSEPEQTAMGRVWVTKGIAKGQGFMLPQNRKVVVGKSTQNANLVINNMHISNIHCSIRYNAEKNSYIVKDHSSNGTFVNGVRLQNGMAMEYPAGTVLSLADGQDEIQLG